MESVEEWRAVVGYEGLYEVSDQGRVRSLERFIRNRGSSSSTGWVRPVTVLNPGVSGPGYKMVSLVSEESKKSFYVHRLVARAFHGEPPPGKNEVCHWDGNKLNNRASNLRWGSPKDNSRDAVRLGRTGNPKRFDTHCGKGHEYTFENTGKTKGGRRCRKCEADSSRVRAKRGGLPTEEDPRHGTKNGYFNWGCRCESCKLAGREHNRRMKEQRKRRNK